MPVPPPQQSRKDLAVENAKKDQAIAKQNDERFKRVAQTNNIDDSMKKLQSMTDDFFSQM